MSERTLVFNPGDVYGKLTVLEDQYYGKYSILYIQVSCECSTVKYVRGSDVKAGKVNSCGCIKKEMQSERATVRNYVHGLAIRGAQHEQLARHHSMMDRCYNSQNKNYHNYGGRGIQVTERWHDLVAFCEGVDNNLGSCPEGMSLDRIDNDGNYEPGNVRWATAKEQANNTRRQKNKNK